MTEKIYSYDEAKTALAKVPDDHVCYGKSPAGVRFYVYAYKSDNHYKPYLKLEVNQVTWMMLRINDVKLPKIPIDYSKAGTGEAPFDGQYVYGILQDSQHLFRVHWVQDEGNGAQRKMVDINPYGSPTTPPCLNLRK